MEFTGFQMDNHCLYYMECVWICKGDPFWFYPSVTWIPIPLDLGKRRIEPTIPTDQQGVSPILVVKCLGLYIIKIYYPNISNVNICKLGKINYEQRISIY